MVAAQARVVNTATPHYVIDVVVPVYNAPDDVRLCVASVLATLRPDVRLVLIDDASPHPGVAAVFAELEQRAHPQVVLLRNDVNRGFTGTANRGMGLSRADVILLNSDTIVTTGWLDALMHCAATDARIGTITPFSNNAEICSFPRFCENNVWRDDDDLETVREALARGKVGVRGTVYPLYVPADHCTYISTAAADVVTLTAIAIPTTTLITTLCP